MPTLRCGTPRVPFDAGGLLDVHAHPPDTFCLRIACAYLSQSGLDTLVNTAAGTREQFFQYASEWIVGLDHGVTEPRALESISRNPNASLRLFCARGNLSRLTLRSAPKLHAKVVAVTERAANVVESVLAGSANFTGAALGPGGLNYEAGIYLSGHIAGNESEEFNRWWRELRRRSLAADAPMIERYAELRHEYLRAFPERMDDLEGPDHPEIRNARFFWIEAGAMSGPPEHRHQIEFAQELASFFHAPRRSIDLAIRYQANPSVERPLTYRGTARGQYVEIWPVLIRSQTLRRLLPTR
jgi:hypothetical protein